MLQSRKLLPVTLAISLTCLAIWFLSLGVGRSASGEALLPSDVPFVGDLLHDFEATAPINYSCYQHPHGGGTCTLTGTASRAAIADFCEAADVSLTYEGTDIQNRQDVLEFLGGRSPQMPGDRASEDSLVMFSTGKRFDKLYGVYDPLKQRYWIWLQFV
ncbi:hypothetical protein [Candidatus Laterigemmans baculatus]|uniref:hypothetical protein n=1 Tax=Candidatus Laterigemmans baculatus TaxID=2770505 RepID=UPI0013DADA6E|nr:hypothetical protein [Candidatus Laterigemmans baculatus]